MRSEHDYSLQPPTQAEYADDIDFITTSQEQQSKITSEIGSILADHNLIVTPDKTELTVSNAGQEMKNTGEEPRN